MSDYVRFLFESMSLVNQAPIAQTFPPPRKNHALPPMIRMGGASITWPQHRPSVVASAGTWPTTCCGVCVNTTQRPNSIRIHCD